MLQETTKMTSYLACSIIEGFCDFEPETDDIISAWSYLIQSREAWRLQGFYGRNAAALINSGTFSNNGEFLGDIN